MLRAREISARELLEAHLERIERLNPAINAVVTLDADGARSAADAADAALTAGEVVGPLHGLPVAHKDTHATGGMRTTWGSPLHADTVPARDELVVARLKAAGAIRVGKTNVPEFAAGSHTFNPVFGVTHNPYRHGLSAGGPHRGGGGGGSGGRAGRRAGAAGRGVGHGRLAAQPRGVLQRRRAASHARPGAVLAGAARLVDVGGAGTAGPNGRRRRTAAVGPRGTGPAGAPLAGDAGRRLRRAAAEVAGRAAGGVDAGSRWPGHRRPGCDRGAPGPGGGVPRSGGAGRRG